MTPPTQFDRLFHERANRLLALSKLSQIVVIALGQANDNPESPFAFSFKKIGESLPSIYSTHASLSIPEYRAVGLADGLTLIASIAEIEGFLQDIVSIVLMKHPEKMGKNTIDINSIRHMSTLSEVLEFAARSYVEKMMFSSPKQYKKDVQEILSFTSTDFDEAWKVYAEAKARRDVGVHNGWKRNTLYISKVKEIGAIPAECENLLIDHPYMNNMRIKAVEIMNALRVHCNATFA